MYVIYYFSLVAFNIFFLFLRLINMCLSMFSLEFTRMGFSVLPIL